MSRPSLSRIVLTAFLLVASTTPLARAEEPSLLGLLDRAWSGLLSLWIENGCGIDPNGGCTSPDNGCGADPNGGCTTLETSDNGCIADPHGGCQPGN